MISLCIQKLRFTKYLSEYRHIPDHHLLHGTDKSGVHIGESPCPADRAVCHDLRIRQCSAASVLRRVTDPPDRADIGEVYLWSFRNPGGEMNFPPDFMNVGEIHDFACFRWNLHNLENQERGVGKADSTKTAAYYIDSHQYFYRIRFRMTLGSGFFM